MDGPEDGPEEGLVERFRAARAARAARGGPELAPAALAAACREVLGVDGAVLSAVARGPWRLPVGASGPAAAAAERWQFAAGQGPGFDAWERGGPVAAGEDALRRTWPVLHDQLHRHTPFGAAAAVPLLRGPARVGVLELLVHRGRPGTAGVAAGAPVDLGGALRLAPLLAAELFGPADGGAGPAEPAWLDAPGARRRQRVWVVLRMAEQVLGLGGTDALALLRARAWAQDRVLEDLADDVVEGRVPVGSLRLDERG
ncbi:GAF domain-containing protein [Kineococcus indalonis]|uniref:GAF domain-containing protein n=1 Tax=Kineococcus indalonis TaxID=2696566 RepID=UPI00141349CA|nr:GAF domain-containing protein [Kineococcus indalonis]NAZ86938.1 GAF domain-containing protein [Kineococcus indalonis]